MNNINNMPSSSFIDNLRWDKVEKEKPKNNGQLTQQDFFALLTHQLSMQDPFKPMQNNEMISQMTSFASLDGINSLKDEIVNLNSVMSSSQALQASSLVGQKVLIKSSLAALSENGAITGNVELTDDSLYAKVKVFDSNGVEVKEIPVTSDTAGSVEFEWDGKDFDGNTMPEGLYGFAAYKDGELADDIKLSTYNKVSSVSLGAKNGITLNLLGGDTIGLDDILAITTG